MKDKRVLLLSSDENFKEQVRKILGELAVVLLPSEVAAAAVKPDLICIDLRTEEDSVDRVVNQYPGVQILVFSARTEALNIQILHKHRQVQHVLMREGDDFAQSLQITLALIFEKLPWTSRSMLSGKAPAFEEMKIQDYRTKTAYLERISYRAADMGCFPDFPIMAKSLAWELVMNAIFSAPVDAKTKKSLYAKKARNEVPPIDPDHIPILRVGVDSRALVIGVEDAYGSLEAGKIVENLYRCQRNDQDQVRLEQGGAGLGLYLMFNTASQLIFIIEPGVRTEVICVLRRTHRRKDYETNPRAISFFVRKSSTKIGSSNQGTGVKARKSVSGSKAKAVAKLKSPKTTRRKSGGKDAKVNRTKRGRR